MITQTRRRGRPQGSGIPPQKCLCCTKPAKIRGLCMADYQAARRKVLDGQTTWEALVAAGLVLPRRGGQGPQPNAFLVKLAAVTSTSKRSSDLAGERGMSAP